MGFWDALTPSYWGKGPQGAPTAANPGGEAQGPFAYAGSERSAGGTPMGYSAGFGLMSGPMGDGGSADVLEAQGHWGGWRGQDGKTNVGVEGDAAVARVGVARGHGLGPVGFSAEALTANANAKATDSTASIGAGANLVAGSVEAGNDHHNARFGLSAGVGLGGRLHYGDADGNGIREMGFGADIGPVSFDVRSELLGRAWNAAADW
jgi:hypothetical protein